MKSVENYARLLYKIVTTVFIISIPVYPAILICLHVSIDYKFVIVIISRTISHRCYVRYNIH